MAAARLRMMETGGAVVLTHDPAEAASGADAVYADVWTSMGDESQKVTRKAAFAGFTVDAQLMQRASPSSHLPSLPAGAPW